MDKEEMKSNLTDTISPYLTRKIVKGIFMPIIYGKSLISAADDLKEHLSQYLVKKEHIDIAKICFSFWRNQFRNMWCLIELVRDIGRLASAKERPVYYRVPYLTTVQDYMKMVPAKIWVYDRVRKKRHRVTFRVITSERDRVKTKTASFVNFIHQRDAYIAIQVVDDMLSLHEAPIYTVHDNFITTTEHSIKKIYSDIFRNMGPPLAIINDFIYMNVIKPVMSEDARKDSAYENDIIKRVIPRDELLYYL